MKLYAKIGTHSQKRIKAGWIRKPPKVGDILRFKSLPIIHGEKWQRAKVDKIKDLGYSLYYLSLW